MGKKGVDSASMSVRVVVRCRPLNKTELANGNERCVEMDVPAGTVKVRNLKTKSEEDTKSFTFDAVYDWNSIQQDLYDETANPIVQDVLEGFNGTIFAYGQTGTGKTFTMEGVRKVPELRGIIPNSFEHIFNEIGRTEGKQYLVRASYLEIYSEEIRDLLSKNQTARLQLKEKPDTGVYVKDLSSFVVKSVKEIEHVMNVGNKNRSVGATEMNATSSRSHAIFIITVECSETGADGENHIRVGKLNLVDLAGSERQGKTKAEGTRLAEGIKINQSLSCLGNVINALVDGKVKHVPYRDSQLTRLLQDSLGGNAKTVMIANMGPADYNYEESINTLRYANRAKNIKNKPKINEDPKDALLREFQEQIAKLKAQLGKDPNRKKKKKKKAKRKREPKFNPETGEEIPQSDSSSEDDGGEGEMTEEEQKAAAAAVMAEERAKLDLERAAMQQNMALSEEEKSAISKKLAARAATLEAEEAKKDAIAQKLMAMEGKLLKGGKNVFDRTTEQERELQKQRQELAAQKQRERDIQRQLKEEEEKKLQAEDTFSSKQQEAEIKTKKLKKLFGKFEAAKIEIEDLQEEFAKEREELSQTFADLQKELKLRQMIIENFVPPEEVAKVEARAEFDAEFDQWRLRPLAQSSEAANERPTVIKRPLSAVSGCRHGVTDDARARAEIDRNPRYRPENIFLVDLDMPDRTTQEYMGPSVDPRVQQALDDALQDEDDITLEAAEEHDFLKVAMRNAKKKEKEKQRAEKDRLEGRVREKKTSRPMARPKVDPSKHVPEARGLVRRGSRFA